MTITCSVGNFKGGVGKTTTTVMIAMNLSKMGKKTLVVDLDPQANATDLLFKTFDIEGVDNSLYGALENHDLSKCRVKLEENLHLLPSDMDLVALPFLLEKKFVFNGSSNSKSSKENLRNRAWYLSSLLSDLKAEYDYILIDTPPTISDFTNNAVVASDYILVVMQTQERSFQAAEKYFPYMQDMINYFDAPVNDYGVVPVLIDNKGSVDTHILDDAKASFEDSLFVNTIKQRQRLKRYDVTGITDADRHDVTTWEMYSDITKEFVERTKGMSN